MARPTKLTLEVERRLVHAISQGVPYKAACEYAGISYQTFLNWKKRAQSDDDGRFIEFFDHIQKARGQAAVLLLTEIEKATKRNWRAAAWKLERMYPHLFGRQRLYHRPYETSFQDGVQRVESPVDKTAGLIEAARVLSENPGLLDQLMGKDESESRDRR